MFEKILIANRGEIAVRIIRACRELGVETVAVYSEVDRDSLHVKYADQAICIGPAPSIASYLNIPNIVSAAVLSGADAVHPGYGYLSERPQFADICESHGLTFIGPSPDQIERLGDKAVAKATMRDAGVPLVPGSDGLIRDCNQLVHIAQEIGYPVIIKAAAGGGGKGMRVIRAEKDLQREYELARAEAGAAFGSDELYLEKYIEYPRHIEVQVVADHHGHIIHLGERECSMQRRYQKVLEEAPSPVVDDQLRQKLGEAAVKGAKAVNYRNVGTVEFLLDNEKNFYFMEMNTRIQVEHPVTEMIYAIDLVKDQIQIAAGIELDYTQEEIHPYGHAIECRINAEDPSNRFMPSPGRIEKLHLPGGLGVRWDSHVYLGSVISPHYDSMFGKLICWGLDRQEAVERMRGALAELEVEGIKTNISLHMQLLEHPSFCQGQYSTWFLEELLRS